MLPAVPVQQFYQVQPSLAPARTFLPQVPTTVGKRHHSASHISRERDLSHLNMVLGKSKTKILKNNVSEDSRAAQIYIQIHFFLYNLCFKHQLEEFLGLCQSSRDKEKQPFCMETNRMFIQRLSFV